MVGFDNGADNRKSHAHALRGVDQRLRQVAPHGAVPVAQQGERAGDDSLHPLAQRRQPALQRRRLAAFVAVEQISSLLPLSFAFAAGAMLALIAVELLPKAYSGPGRRGPSVGVACGAALMLILSLLLGV